MQEKAKTWFKSFLKLFFACGILAWLIRSGKLDFTELTFFIKHPATFVIPSIGWFVFILILGAYRWRTLLLGIGLQTMFYRVVQLHWIGLFFNTTMPGAVGGDLIKGVYVIQDHRNFRTKAALTILLDRVIGLMGLFTIGGVMAVFNLRDLLENSVLCSLTIFVLAVCGGIIVFFFLVFFPVREHVDPVRKILTIRFPGSEAIRKVYEALLIYQERPWVLVKAWAASVVLQGYVLAVIIFFTFMINGSLPSMSKLIPLLSIALLLTALPLAPAGIGVGHVAFGQMFKIAGAENGANVFNAYMLLNLFLNLTGSIAYIFFKGSTPRLSPSASVPE